MPDDDEIQRRVETNRNGGVSVQTTFTYSCSKENGNQ